MTSNAQKLGNLMLHGGDRSISYRDSYNGKINKVISPHFMLNSDYTGQTSATANNANGVYLGRSHTYSPDSRGSKFISITMKGYISSGTYYWAWALWNGTQSHYVPIVTSGVGQYSGSAKTRTITTLNGSETFNCVVPYIGAVHSYSSQTWATFDCSNESNGDALYIYGAADDGSGSTWYDNASQTIYIKEVLLGYGSVTGVQYDHDLT